MSNAFVAPHFQSPELAREWLENLRWPEGPICSHCGTINHAYKTKKPGWYRCAEKECRKDFTVTTGTVMERSHIPLNKWLMAFYLLNASKKGMSAHQLHRALRLDYKSAWFMCHRIREAMRAGNLGPLGGDGEIVEADETYFGKMEKPRVSPARKGRPYKVGSRGPRDKRPIVALVERGGNVRTFHVPFADKATVGKIVADNVARESRLHTDEMGAVLGCFGSYWIGWLERRRQRRMARMQTVINLRRWMKRSLDQILDMQIHESSGGAGGAVHLRIPNFRFEKSLEIIALLEPGMAEKIFGLIDDKDNANAEVQADTEERYEDTALDTFRGRSAQAWLTAWGIYRKLSGQIGWSDRAFSDKDKGTMQEENDRFDKLKQRRDEPNELF